MVTANKSAGLIFRLDTQHQLRDQMLGAIRRHLLNTVDVMIDSDLIELSGSVDSWYEKQLAQETIRASARDRRIRNRIQVCSF